MQKQNIQEHCPLECDAMESGRNSELIKRRALLLASGSKLWKADSFIGPCSLCLLIILGSCPVGNVTGCLLSVRLTWKMEAVGSCGTLVRIYQTLWHNIPEDSLLCSHCSYILKSKIFLLLKNLWLPTNLSFLVTWVWKGDKSGTVKHQ